MKPNVLMLALMLLPKTAAGQVTWKTNLPTAKQEAAVARKPLLLMFHATWCGPCREMEETTFHDATVLKLLQGMVCVRLDVDREQATARAYSVDSIPRVLIMPVGGSTPIMDIIGYRDAAQFTDELRAALHLKPTADTTGAEERPEINQVRDALTAHSYSKLKSSDPKAAAVGLKGLIAQLGVFDEHEIDPIVALLSNAGNDAVPALIDGMSDRFLAVRTGAYRALQALLRDRHISTTLRFDPWAPGGERQRQLTQWKAWWRRHP